jgi:hypothetical protein
MEGQHQVVLAIVGSRTFSDRQLLHATLAEFVVRHGKPSLVVSGGARGADALGEAWAKAHRIPTRIFRPDWSKKGRAAGVLRNTDIVNACTHVVAFPSTRGKGTQDTVRKAKAQGKPVVEIHWDDT